jgi:hypothetical protein
MSNLATAAHFYFIYFLFINQALDIVPEGSLIFFPRFYPLEIFVEKWRKNNVLKKILKNLTQWSAQKTDAYVQ